MESEENKKCLCENCSNKAWKEFQNNFNKYNIEVGDYIKTIFKQKDKPTEHMWVIVDGLLNKGISGRLSNIPFELTSVKFGDQVEVNYIYIEDLIKRNEKVGE